MGPFTELYCESSMDKNPTIFKKDHDAAEEG